jgi:hypothetical protein
MEKSLLCDLDVEEYDQAFGKFMQKKQIDLPNELLI